MPQPPSPAIYYQARRSENLISPTACSRNSPSFGIFPLHNILPRVASLLLLSHPVSLTPDPSASPLHKYPVHCVVVTLGVRPRDAGHRDARHFIQRAPHFINICCTEIMCPGLNLPSNLDAKLRLLVQRIAENYVRG